MASAFAYRDDGYLITSARALGGVGSVMVVSIPRALRIEPAWSDSTPEPMSRSSGSAPRARPWSVADSGMELGDKIALVDPDGGADRGNGDGHDRPRIHDRR